MSRLLHLTLIAMACIGWLRTFAVLADSAGRRHTIDSTQTRYPAPGAALLEPGSHLVTPRCGYTHHGIYVGHGKVVQYGGLARGLHWTPVEEVSLEEFAGHHPVWLRRGRAPRFDADEIVRRARARLGENRYHVLTNNCEHFCEWCLHAEHRSEQVDQWRTIAGRAVRGLSWIFTCGARGRNVFALVAQLK